MNMDLGKALKTLREKKGISLRRLAAQMNISPSTVSRWENGSRLPDDATIIRLSEILGADVSVPDRKRRQMNGAAEIVFVFSIGGAVVTLFIPKKESKQ